ncbi:uncharacterized protein LOC124939113 [Impatiens glandulifera]|uniref:uncharacterized protein LOC124939113 n=1 Tax=Impatiens glandulifera TaxID=253017 RepID=UPI001FB08306|nr:uncharacterized protein LOC124939113 [Impatiens glandulifera]
MEMKHFSHEHNLHLHEEDGYSNKHFCNGCWQRISISGSYYRCNNHSCQYSLHKRCAEQPHQINYPLHKHPLTLLPQPPYRSHRCYCSSCYKSQWQHFTYHCPICKYDLDIECALRATRINHKSHNHPLIPLQKSSSFFCQACRKRDVHGPSYVCSDCQFWVHQKCADCFPSSVLYEHNNQSHHTLQLSYSFPSDFHRFLSFCEICLEILNKRDWVYYCSDCRYFVHSDCLLSLLDEMGKDGKPALSSTNNLVETIEDESIITHLPPIDEFINPLTLFINRISLDHENQSLLEHASHEHKLILVLELQESDNNTILVNEHMKDKQTCAGCCSIIMSPPFYKCVESQTSNNCPFHLHKHCAQLPEKLNRHPSHPDHPLVLSMELYGIIRCNNCKKLCLGFVFSCHNCRFYLDIACASLLFGSIMTHDLHQHSPMMIREFRESDGHRCSGCTFLLTGIGFACIACEYFKIDVECALLLRGFNHRFDEHPFVLSYSPVKGIEEYICEICEFDINPRQWFYCCGICDHSIHSECILPICDHPTVVFNQGNFISTPHHCHRLILEKSIDVGLSCDCCGKSFGEGLGGFECFECSFRIHRECADMPQEVKLQLDDHPLRLLSSNSSLKRTRVRVCILCGLELDLELWFYYCGICDQSAHLECVSKYQVVLIQSSRHGLRVIWRTIIIE